MGNIESPLIWKVRYLRSRERKGIEKVGNTLIYSGSAKPVAYPALAFSVTNSMLS